MARGITADIAKALMKAAKETDKTFPKKVEKELKETYKSVIREWYDSYDPTSYRRKYRLTDMFEVKSRTGSVKYRFHTDDVDYGGKEDYIYSIAMMGGWHGGADRGAGHPNPGTPWYRNLRSNTWLRPAERSFSPYENMMEIMNIKVPLWQQQMTDEFMKNFEKYK